MKVGSLFAGVGGFDLALERVGFTTAWLVENDKHCQTVLRKRFPNAKVYGDVREVGNPSREHIRLPDDGGPCKGTTSGSEPQLSSGGAYEQNQCGVLTPVSVICGGFPCQDYSVAGKRGGLVGDRGALWWEMHRIIADIRPTWVIGENVPGLLSNNGGRDFLTIIASLVQLGYGVTWASIDSEYRGVAQRRKRLFIVGHSGGVPRPEILALSEGLFGHPAPSREAGQEVAGSIGGSSDPSGKRRNDLDNHGAYPLAFHATQDPISGEQCPTLGSNMTAGVHAPAVALPITAREGKGPNSDADSGNIVGTVPRRLTPIECERLQGFPDNWTQVEHRGKPMADGPRYRMIGNAVTVNVVEWIAERIMEAEK